MANIEYAHPFSYGETTALSNLEKAQNARQTNLDYRFNEWYQPLKQAETQNNTGAALLKELAAIAHYTGDYTHYNAVLGSYFGIQPGSLPPGYAAGKGTAAQTKSADLASGQLPVPLSYPNVFSAGGVGAYPATPPGAPPDAELETEKRAAILRYYKNLNNPEAAPEANVPHLNPLYGVPTPAAPGATTATGAPPIPAQTPVVPQNPQAPPRIAGAQANAADATKSLGTTDAASAYGVPTPQKKPSIFEGEYNPSDFSMAQ